MSIAALTLLPLGVLCVVNPLVSAGLVFPIEIGEVRPDAECTRAFVVEREVKNVQGRIVLLPESIGGQVTQSSAFLWDRVRRRIDVKALGMGGERGFSTHRENGLYLIDGGGAAKKRPMSDRRVGPNRDKDTTIPG